MTERGKRPHRFWNEEEKQALREAVYQGWNQEAIAAQLTEDFGFTVTVGAVAGRVYRMGLREALGEIEKLGGMDPLKRSKE